MSIPKSYANYLFYTSHASLISGLYGLYRQNAMALYPLCVYFASINYWRNPVNGIRRYIDMSCAGICLVCQTLHAKDSPNFREYIITMNIGILFYPIGIYFQHKNLTFSIFAHSMIHIVCNIANYIILS